MTSRTSGLPSPSVSRSCSFQAGFFSLLVKCARAGYSPSFTLKPAPGENAMICRFSKYFYPDSHFIESSKNFPYIPVSLNIIKRICRVSVVLTFLAKPRFYFIFFSNQLAQKRWGDEYIFEGILNKNSLARWLLRISLTRKGEACGGACPI